GGLGRRRAGCLSLRALLHPEEAGRTGLPGRGAGFGLRFLRLPPPLYPTRRRAHDDLARTHLRARAEYRNSSSTAVVTVERVTGPIFIGQQNRGKRQKQRTYERATKAALAPGTIDARNETSYRIMQ